MTEYQKPYHILWSGISDALAAIRAQNFGLAQELLLQAQQQAAVDEKAAGFDIIITTAKVPGCRRSRRPKTLSSRGTSGKKKRRLAEKQVSVFWAKG